VVLQPSLGAGQLAFAVMQNWPGPVILWATPERQESEKVSSCSLVAQHLWAAMMRQAHHPFEIVYGDPDDREVRQALSAAIAMSTAAAALKRAKVGVVGAQAPGFITMTADPFAMRTQLGAQLHVLSLLQFVDRVRALKLPLNGVSQDDLPMQSRVYLAMKQLIEEEQLDALAMQEWPELPNVLGQWPYLGMSRLQDEGYPLSMEGDVDAAIALLLGRELGAGVGFITDWLEHDRETITFWHAGVAPIQMLSNPSLGNHFNIQKPLVVDGALRTDQPITVMRLWRCDDRYHLTAVEARAIAPRRKLTGNTLTIQLENGRDARQWFETLVHAGMPHHPILFTGKHADDFRRLARMIGVVWLSRLGRRLRRPVRHPKRATQATPLQIKLEPVEFFSRQRRKNKHPQALQRRAIPGVGDIGLSNALFHHGNSTFRRCFGARHHGLSRGDGVH
jgi:L-arabinose isomerase